MLKLGQGISFPEDAITETFGILAARGAGKSNTGAVMAEEMFAAGLPFVVIDPVGSWWGLRSSKTGRGPGLDIPLFGGKRGDVPLERTGGQLVADLVVDERISCILDLTQFDSEAAKKHFLLDFARRLYKRNEYPLHLFLEEADDYIPQRPMRDEAQLLRAWENIVRRGRARGLGMTMITQRSASINKNVLTQVQTLIAMRTTGPHDRKAIEDWVKYNDQSRDILESLPKLADGEAWIWSPQFLKTTKRVKFRRRHTFDSGSTPKMAAKSKTVTLADVNVDRLREQMADTIKRTEADDPQLLKKRIFDLKKQLHNAEKSSDSESVVLALRGELDATRAECVQLNEHAEKMATALREAKAALRVLFEELGTAGERLTSLSSSIRVPETPKMDSKPKIREVRDWSVDMKTRELIPIKRTLTQSPRPSGDGKDDTLNGPQRRIIDALAWLEAIGIDRPENAAVAFMAGYKPSGGAYQSPRSSLSTAGLITYPGGGLVQLTDTGRAIANFPSSATGPELRERVLAKLNGPQCRILKPLIEAYPKSMDNEDLAAAAGYEPKGGAYQSPRSSLSTLGLIEYPSPGRVSARDILFPELSV